jgi:hypothetical protein
MNQTKGPNILLILGIQIERNALVEFALKSA